MSGHTKEPWAPGFYMGTEYPFNIVAPDGRVLATVRGEQDRHRIVACVNACAGIPTNALIAAGQSAVMALRPVDELVAENQRLIADLGTACQEVKTERRLSFRDQVADLEQQRNDLLAASQAVIGRWDTPLWKDVPATAGFINELRAAVARVKP